MTPEWMARIFLIVIIILFIIWTVRKYKQQHHKRESKFKGINDINAVKKFVYAEPIVHFQQVSRPHKNNKKAPAKKVNKTEEKCREIMEEIFNKPFPSVRPSFLCSPRTGKNLELDCYNAELKIAVEYNGPQHYKYTPYFHKSKQQFYSQVHRDDWKRKKCREMGIKLIEIPYWISDRDKLKEYIVKQLK